MVAIVVCVGGRSIWILEPKQNRRERGRPLDPTSGDLLASNARRRSEIKCRGSSSP